MKNIVFYTQNNTFYYHKNHLDKRHTRVGEHRYSQCDSGRRTYYVVHPLRQFFDSSHAHVPSTTPSVRHIYILYRHCRQQCFQTCFSLTRWISNLFFFILYHFFYYFCVLNIYQRFFLMKSNQINCPYFEQSRK